MSVVFSVFSPTELFVDHCVTWSRRTPRTLTRQSAFEPTSKPVSLMCRVFVVFFFFACVFLLSLLSFTEAVVRAAGRDKTETRRTHTCLDIYTPIHAGSPALSSRSL